MIFSFLSFLCAPGNYYIFPIFFFLFLFIPHIILPIFYLLQVDEIQPGGSEFDPSILRHSAIFEAADEAVLTKALEKIQKNPLLSFYIKTSFPSMPASYILSFSRKITVSKRHQPQCGHYSQ
jgi:hypothetical protein